MQMLWYALLNVFYTLLRMLPVPRPTGLIRVGHPGRDAPVLLTCNYCLTVQRVRRALHGLDGYLLVANSRGVNVWCAATGGLLTHHDVISALKTSGIEALVDHRVVILPQLAATGVEVRAVRERAGWEVVWGPVYTDDIPAYLATGRQATPDMRQVRFPLRDRIEMAVAWAFPISVIAALALLPFWRAAILPLVLVVWGIALLAFVAFPLYAPWLDVKRERVGLIAFDLGRGGIQLILWGLCLAALIGLALLSDRFGWGDVLRWGFATLVVVLIVSMDLTGSTPVLKSGLHPDRAFWVTLDAERCIGCGTCSEVCPRACLALDPTAGVVALAAPERCVQCGACIVQCPADALAFAGRRAGLCRAERPGCAAGHGAPLQAQPDGPPQRAP